MEGGFTNHLKQLPVQTLAKYLSSFCLNISSYGTLITCCGSLFCFGESPTVENVLPYAVFTMTSSSWRSFRCWKVSIKFQNLFYWPKIPSIPSFFFMVSGSFSFPAILSWPSLRPLICSVKVTPWIECNNPTEEAIILVIVTLPSRWLIDHFAHCVLSTLSIQVSAHPQPGGSA